MLSPLNIFDFVTGDPESLREQLVKEQTNIGLVSALVLTVSAAFLLNVITPDGSECYSHRRSPPLCSALPPIILMTFDPDPLHIPCE